jgi:hypothetical protein
MGYDTAAFVGGTRSSYRRATQADQGFALYAQYPIRGPVGTA